MKYGTRINTGYIFIKHAMKYCGYDNEYVGRTVVSMTNRVLPLGCAPVRNDLTELRAANAIRGIQTTADTAKKLTFNRLRLDIFI